jgi:prepilin signal peptidase PulO-like enzyme (type II secretory pathway)
MKPQYWIGILAIAGSLTGTILGFIFSDLNGSKAAVTGTLIGIVAGTILFVILQKDKKDKK